MPKKTIKDYPKNWREIADKIKERDGWRRIPSSKILIPDPISISIDNSGDFEMRKKLGPGSQTKSIGFILRCRRIGGFMMTKMRVCLTAREEIPSIA